MPKSRIRRYLKTLTQTEAQKLLYDWDFWARPAQKPPPGAWVHWLVLAGRGFGKTRTGAEWIRRLAETGAAGRMALVAPTAGDARATMVEGESGVLAISPPGFRPSYAPSLNRLTWPNGAIATLYSADQPERLRGPQHDAAWVDELCAWRNDQAAWDMLMFGLRLGRQPRSCITTTPKPRPLLRALRAQAGVHVTHGSTYDNIGNLAPTFARDILAKYEGTRLGRQELYAEILDDVPGALWSRKLLETQRCSQPPPLERIIVAIDPPASSGSTAGACGIIVAGRAGRQAYVLADASVQGLSPLGWAEQAVRVYHEFAASRLIAEVNQGGEMVETILRQVDPGLAVRRVHARRGKLARAEPVAALYEQRRVFHMADFTALEDQMCSYTGAPGEASPDRLDALVWALGDLLLAGPGSPQLRSL